MSTVFKMTFLAMYTVGNVQAISGGRLRGINIGIPQSISDGIGEIIILKNQPRHMRTDHVRNVLEEEQNARKYFQGALQDFNQAKREEQAAKQVYFQDSKAFEEEQAAKHIFQEALQDFNQAKREEQAAKQAYFQDSKAFEEEQAAKHIFQEALQGFNQAKREEQTAKQVYFQDNAVFSGIPSNVAESNIVRVKKQLKRLRSMAPTNENLKIKNDLESLLSLSKNSRHDDINNLGEWISSLEFKIDNKNN